VSKIFELGIPVSMNSRCFGTKKLYKLSVDFSLAGLEVMDVILVTGSKELGFQTYGRDRIPIPATLAYGEVVC
jgi:hypothetical protein